MEFKMKKTILLSLAVIGLLALVSCSPATGSGSAPKLYSAYFSTTQFGSVPIASCNSGDIVYLILKTSDADLDISALYSKDISTGREDTTTLTTQGSEFWAWSIMLQPMAIGTWPTDICLIDATGKQSPMVRVTLTVN
jgi:hypothetical protein